MARRGPGQSGGHGGRACGPAWPSRHRRPARPRRRRPGPGGTPRARRRPSCCRCPTSPSVTTCPARRRPRARPASTARSASVPRHARRGRPGRRARPAGRHARAPSTGSPEHAGVDGDDSGADEAGRHRAERLAGDRRLEHLARHRVVVGRHAVAGDRVAGRGQDRGDGRGGVQAEREPAGRRPGRARRASPGASAARPPRRGRPPRTRARGACRWEGGGGGPAPPSCQRSHSTTSERGWRADQPARSSPGSGGRSSGQPRHSQPSVSTPSGQPDERGQLVGPEQGDPSHADAFDACRQPEVLDRAGARPQVGVDVGGPAEHALRRPCGGRSRRRRRPGASRIPCSWRSSIWRPERSPKLSACAVPLPVGHQRGPVTRGRVADDDEAPGLGVPDRRGGVRRRRGCAPARPARGRRAGSAGCRGGRSTAA